MTFLKYLAAAIFAIAGVGTASAMSDHELEEMSAFIINANGYLCAEVLSISPAGGADNWRVRCVEYRDGSGRKTYIMNARSGTARPY